MHVDMQFSEVWGEGLDTPIGARGNYTNDILSLVKMFHELMPDPTSETDHNPFQGVSGVGINAGDMRLRRPWAFIN